MYKKIEGNLSGKKSVEKEEQITAGRFSDLAYACYNRNIPVFSDFLNLNEQNILHTMTKSFPPICVKTEGGYGTAERRVAVFLPENDRAYTLPVRIIRITADKHYGGVLTHRDYLGALMNLGIERSLLGDIVLTDGIAYAFCADRIAEYIMDNLSMVRNAGVCCSLCDDIPKDFGPSYEEITGSVASLRLDALISMAFKESRSRSVSYIEGGLVFVNGKLITTNAYNLKEGEIISVRGHGRFMYMYTKNETKKGRYMVVINKYI